MAGILDRKVALVTGGASGIGRATALAMAREGARVAVADRTEENAAATVALINAAGGQAFVAYVAVRSEDRGHGVARNRCERRRRALGSTLHRGFRSHRASRPAALPMPESRPRGREASASRSALPQHALRVQARFPIDRHHSHVRHDSLLFDQGIMGLNIVRTGCQVAAVGIAAVGMSRSGVIGSSR